MSKPRDLSKLFTSNTNIATDVELINISTAASANALTQANNYTDSEINTIDLTSTINTASAAAYASASAYTDSAIASFEALPSQSGNDGKYLSTDGSTTSWAALDLNAAINTASAAAYASASAYTDSQISNIDLSATIQTASAAAVTYLVDSAPSTLDTLNELAQALGDDENFATTVTNSLANKLNYSTASAIYLTQTSASNTYATIADVNTSLSRWSKIYSASATLISGVDDNANNLDYTLGHTTLFINGILQDPTNYTATSGSAIVLSDPALTNDVVEILSYKTFNVANTYTTSEIDSKISNYTRWVKTLSGSATVISGVDDNSLPLSYTIGNEEVYVNGILLKRDTDYDTTSVNAITLTEAALSGDTVEIITLSTINLASVYTQTQSDDKYLTPTTASTIYLTQSSASVTFATIEDLNNLDALPNQTGNNGKYLITNGASASWATLDLSTKADKLVTFDPETASYALIIGNADQIIEMNVGTANTVTVPLDSSVNFPTGTQITILQTGTGQTTITPATVGVTINATPGLKLRTQWSSATLIKRAANIWVAIGDLSP
jgi:hypothetical protein